jgi:hypothetical protein
MVHETNINHVENAVLQHCHGTTIDSIVEVKWHDSSCLPLKEMLS